MTPKKIGRSGQDDLFRTRLEDIINPHHALVRLAHLIDWRFFEDAIEPLYSKKGRCGVPVRFMAGLHILKHVYGLSDEAVCERWVESPYFQYFTGEEYFVHELSYDRSNMSNWRKRVSEDDLACLIQDSLRIACEKGALDQKDLKRVTVDTTVQPKAITFPTDTKLMYKTILMLGNEAKRHGVPLRQSYVRVGKHALMKAQRYIHARQFKRFAREERGLRTRLGRIIRDIERKIQGNTVLEEAFTQPLSLAQKVHTQMPRQKGDKIYALHALEVECIGKAKAHTPYEFGCKVSVATTNQRSLGGQFVTHIKALHGRPHDAYTLKDIIIEMTQWTGIKPERIYVDRGYRGHHLQDTQNVFISGQKRGLTPQIKRELKRRSAIEPVIGHMKHDGRLGRNFLKGQHGDKINAILSGIGHNFRLLIKWLNCLCLLYLQITTKTKMA